MFRACSSANEDTGSNSGMTESVRGGTATSSGWGPVFWFILEIISVHAPDPLCHLCSSLVQHQHAYESHFPFTSSMHVQSVKTSLYFILYFAANLHIQRRPVLCQEYTSWRNHLPHTESGCQTLVFPEQPAACTLFHPPAETCQSIPFPCFIRFGSFDGAPILSNFSLLGGGSISNWKWKYNSFLSYR